MFFWERCFVSEFARMSPENQQSSNQPEGLKDKLCRTCVDFKTWMKQQKSTMTQSHSVSNQGTKVEEKVNDIDFSVPSDCPLDKDLLGRNTWGFLHTMAAYFPDVPTERQATDMRDFLTLFAKFYPCEICREDLQKNIIASPPDVSSRTRLSIWMCEEHNRVNRKLGKPEFDCSLVDQRWRDGWTDGRCG